MLPLRRRAGEENREDSAEADSFTEGRGSSSVECPGHAPEVAPVLFGDSKSAFMPARTPVQLLAE